MAVSRNATVSEDVVSVVLDSVNNSAKFKACKSLSEQCSNDAFVDGVIHLVEDLTDRDQLVYPFVFLCSSSGTGKTTLAFNIGMKEVPFLYFLYNYKIPGRQIQNKYLPFVEISEQLKCALKCDVKFVQHQHALTRGEPHGVSLLTGMVDTDSLSVLTGLDSQRAKFLTVGMIVSLFKHICNEKQKYPSKSWIEIQAELSQFNYSALTINDGKVQLRKIYEGTVSFVTFADECILSKESGSSKFDEIDAAELILLRSILRLLTTVPILAGTDALTSNFLMTTHHGSRGSGFDVWAACISDLNCFNPKVFLKCRQRISAKFTGHPRLTVLEDVMDFLEASIEYENPLLISHSIDFLYLLSGNEVDNLANVLKKMVKYVFKSFTVAKNSGSEFTESQFGYLYAYSLGQCELVASTSHEFTVNRHLGSVYALRYAQDEPYFYLGLEKTIPSTSSLPFNEPNDPESDSQDSKSGETDSLDDMDSSGSQMFPSNTLAFVKQPVVRISEQEEPENPNLLPLIKEFDVRSPRSASPVKGPGLLSIYSSLEYKSVYIHPFPAGETFRAAPDDLLPLLETSRPYGQESIDDKMIPVDFKSESTFHSFYDAPLTGLILFGLDTRIDQNGLYQPPFLKRLTSEHSAVRVSTFDAVLDHFWSSRGISFKKSGLFLEYLFNAATVVSSRVNSLEGTPLLSFLACFIRELSSQRKKYDDPIAGQLSNRLPKIITGNCDIQGLSERRIPLISPMSVSGWHPAAVSLLRKASNDKCSLGTFLYSTGHEVVDSVVLEFDLNVSGRTDGYHPEAVIPPIEKPHIQFRDRDNVDEKRYGDWGKSFPLKKEYFTCAKLIGECKQYRNPLTLKHIVDTIIHGKFMKGLAKWEPIKGMRFDGCETFIILTFLAGDLRRTDSVPDPKLLSTVIDAGYNLWQLRRDKSDFRLNCILGDSNRKDAKDVIVISMDTIVGREFITTMINTKMPWLKELK